MKCDAKGFARMYETIYVDLYRFALSLMKHPQDAEDAVSEAVISGYENIAKLRKEEAFKSWMFTILANVCKKKLKQKEKFSKTTVEDVMQMDVGAQETDYGLSVDLQRALFVLTQEEQMIVAFSVFGGYNSSEIAVMMKSKPGTIRSKQSRAFAKMKVVLGDDKKYGERSEI